MGILSKMIPGVSGRSVSLYGWPMLAAGIGPDGQPQAVAVDADGKVILDGGITVPPGVPIAPDQAWVTGMAKQAVLEAAGSNGISMPNSGIVAIDPTWLQNKATLSAVRGTSAILSGNKIADKSQLSSVFNAFIAASIYSAVIDVSGGTMAVVGTPFGIVGNRPFGVCFDDTNIWCCNWSDGTVNKLAFDGTVLGTFSVTSNPFQIIFDGANIWVSDYSVNTVTELDLNGNTIGTYTAGSVNNICVLCTDGVGGIWIANEGDNTVTKLLTSDGSAAGAYSTGSTPTGMCSDGTHIWVTNLGDATVTRLLIADGSLVGTYNVGSSPIGCCFDGTNIWVSNSGDDTVTKLLASDGSTLGTYSVGSSPEFVICDGTNIWCSNYGDSTVTKLLASNGSIIGTYNTDNGPVGMCFGGGNVWIANANGNTVTKLLASDGSSSENLLYDAVQTLLNNGNTVNTN